MKKIILTFTLLIACLFVVACNRDDQEVTHQEVFDSIVIGFGSGDSIDHVTQNIQLPTTTSFEGVKLTWVSANENIISSSGVVNRPESMNKQVLLILEVVINGVSDEKNFLLTVIATNPTVEDKYYTVTFNSNGGSNVTSLSIKENNLIAKPANPTKAGHTFDGWYKDSNLSTPWNFTSDTVTSNITLYAKWIKDGVQYTVTFESNGGSLIDSQTVNESSKVTKPSDPTKADYEFEGWFQDEGLTIPWNFDVDLVNSNITLYAKWTPIINYYGVEFVSNGGSEVASLVIEENTLIPEPQMPSRTNYVFNGWYMDEELTLAWDFENDLVTKDLTLYASWYPEGAEPGLPVYIVSFETNGGTSVNLEFVVENHLISNTVTTTREDFEFVGWYKDEELTTPWDFDVDTVTSNITLYAKWHELAPKLPAPINGINFNPSIFFIAIGTYDFEEGANGGYTGYGLVFTNTTTGEVFIWRKPHTYKAGFATYFTPNDLAPAGIVLTPGNYKFEFFAMGNGVTTRDSDLSYHTANFTIEKPELDTPVLSIDKENKLLTWQAVSHATSYEVYINDVLQDGNTSPIDLSGISEPGVYVIKVKAMADTHRPSEATINYVIENLEAPKLPAPINFQIDGFKLTWDEVEHAIGYTISIGNVTKQSSTNSFDLAQFEIGNQTVTVRVVALGNVTDYANSDETLFDASLPALLPRLNPMTVGDQNGDIYGFGGGHFRLLVHMGHAPFLQADWDGTFRIVVKKDGVVLGETVTRSGEYLHTPGSSTDFYGAILTNGVKYTVEISLIAKPDSGHRDSTPLAIEFTYTK